MGISVAHGDVGSRTPVLVELLTSLMDFLVNKTKNLTLDTCPNFGPFNDGTPTNFQDSNWLDLIEGPVKSMGITDRTNLDVEGKTSEGSDTDRN